MAVSSKPYLKLVEEAYNGKLKLPAFQRDWVWSGKQSAALFDSIRLDFPIGAFLFSSSSLEINLGPKAFKFASNSAEGNSAEFLVLDGQQRITAGVQLFYGTSSENGDTIHFFLDISKLKQLYDLFCEARDLESANFSEVSEFSRSVDIDDAYIVAKKASKNPYKLLIENDLLFVPLLRPDLSKQYEAHLDGYLEIKPHMKSFMRNIISEFKIINTPNVPYISLDGELSAESISRIFSTLNTSGKMLTPFELVVAILYPSGIDLREELKIGLEIYSKYYPRMDKTGEIVLQTCVLLEGIDPKKSKLPKTLTAPIWKKNKEQAFLLLEEAGEFLTRKLGFALDQTDEIIPYDSLFAPLAAIIHRTGLSSMDGGSRAKAEKKLSKWVAASVFSQRYQEGVHNKQKADSDRISSWIAGNSDEPDWVAETRVPALTRVAPKGAIGKFIFCLIGTNQLRDPLDSKEVRIGSVEANYHHIFPTKYVSKLAGWDKSDDNSNRALNMMIINRSTNVRFLNSDPRDQIEECIDIHNLNKVHKIYSDQMISENCIGIIRKSGKKAHDYRDFLKLREAAIAEYVKDQFGIEFSGTGIDDEL